MNRNGVAAVALTGLLAATSLARAQEAPAEVVALANLAGALEIGPPVKHDRLTVYPLKAPRTSSASPYESLDRAVKENKLRVREQGSGDVPRLRVKNLGKKRVFIMTGEIMTGAKQDRMAAQDVLVPPKKRNLDLKVYCVEAGRWVMKSGQFAAGGTAATKKLRRSAAKKYGQGKIWDDVAEKSRESSVDSATGTMQAVFRDRRVRQKLAAYEKALSDLPERTENMIGFVAITGGHLSTADVFASPALLSDLWKKLLRAAALDAITAPENGQSAATAADVAQFLQDGFSGRFNLITNPGEGKELLVDGENGVSGSTLVDGSSVVHLALFSPEKGAEPRELRTDIKPQRGKSYRVKGGAGIGKLKKARGSREANAKAPKAKAPRDGEAEEEDFAGDEPMPEAAPRKAVPRKAVPEKAKTQ